MYIMIYIYIIVVKNGSETLSGSLAPHFLLGNVGMDTHGNRSLAQESLGDCLPSGKHGLLENNQIYA